MKTYRLKRGTGCPRPNPHSERRLAANAAWRSAAWVAFGMSWSAGFIDAGCYRRVQQTYTSHITGSTVSIASHVASGPATAAGQFAVAVTSFLFGLLIGASLRHVQRREKIRSAFALVLVIEIVLIALFIACGRSSQFPIEPLIFFAACAMGMQTVTVTRVGPVRVYTTFHTGSASKFSEAVASYLFWAWDRMRGRFCERMVPVLRVSGRQQAVQQATVTAGVWIAFLIGALAATPAVNRWGLIALIAAMAPLAWAIVVDWRKPAALGERDPGIDLE